MLTHRTVTQGTHSHTHAYTLARALTHVHIQTGRSAEVTGAEVRWQAALGRAFIFEGLLLKNYRGVYGESVKCKFQPCQINK